MKNIQFIIFLFVTNLVHAQNTAFTTEFNSNFSERVFQVIEDDDGNYIYTGLESPSPYTYNGKIIKLNAQGEIIDSLFITAINPLHSLSVIDIVQVGNNYICIGLAVDQLSFIKLDKNFNIITRKESTLAPFIENNFIGTAFLMCDSDSNLIISGGLDTLINVSNRRAYLYKLNLNGDSIKVVYPQPTFSTFSDVMEQAGNTGYIALGIESSGFYRLNTIQHYDVNFNLFKTDTLKDFRGLGGSSLVQIEDTLFVAGRSTVIDLTLLDSYETLSIKKLTTNNDSINQKIIEGGELGKETVPALFDAIDEYNNNLFTTGTIRYESGNVFPFAEEKLAIVVAKTDLDLNILWKKKIAEDSVRYHAYGIIATQDGGCLIYGTKYDWRVQNNHTNTIVIKFDEFGNTTWIKEEALKEISLSIFPNPTKDYINYKTQYDVIVQKIEIINMEGQKIKEFLDPQKSLNVQDLNHGVYLMRFFTNHDIIIKKLIIE